MVVDGRNCGWISAVSVFRGQRIQGLLWAKWFLGFKVNVLEERQRGRDRGDGGSKILGRGSGSLG